MIIWLMTGIIVLAGFLYLAHPLYSAAQASEQKESELSDYQNRINALDVQIKQGGDAAALLQAKTELQRQIIGSAARVRSPSGAPSKLLLGGVFSVLFLGGFGLYSNLGNPKLIKARMNEVTSKTKITAENFPDIVARLGVQLKENPNNIEGWQIYARSLMKLGQYSEALEAYEILLVLTKNDVNILAEFEDAKKFIAGQARPQISDEAILNMVEGLSEKLKLNPNDADGWIRLIRSRQVLGQTDKLASEIAAMKAAFANNPNEAARILRESGYQE